MWAARQWCVPHTQFTTINPAAIGLPIAVPVRFTAANRLSIGVPRKFQVYSQLDLGYAAAEKKQQIGKKSAEEQVEEGNSKEKLSGSDVLEALQKATAQKMKKKRNGRDSSSSSRKVIGHGRKGTREDEAMADYGNNKIVRPISIKEDWGTRLDELEKRLEQLNMHNS